MNNLTIYVFYATLIFALLGCDLCEEVEVLRKPSDDNKVEVVLISEDCGATTATAVLFYLVTPGSSVDSKHPILTMDRAENLEVRWLESKMLEVSYSSGRIYTFTNFWNSREIDNFEYTVNINLLKN